MLHGGVAGSDGNEHILWLEASGQQKTGNKPINVVDNKTVQVLQTLWVFSDIVQATYDISATSALTIEARSYRHFTPIGQAVELSHKSAGTKVKHQSVFTITLILEVVPEIWTGG
jgi:hypothetical protein